MASAPFLSRLSSARWKSTGGAKMLASMREPTSKPPSERAVMRESPRRLSEWLPRGTDARHAEGAQLPIPKPGNELLRTLYGGG